MQPRQSTDECADEGTADNALRPEPEEHQAEACGKLIGAAFDNEVGKNQIDRGYGDRSGDQSDIG